VCVCVRASERASLVDVNVIIVDADIVSEADVAVDVRSATRCKRGR
jgi:hypothetical protein